MAVTSERERPGASCSPVGAARARWCTRLAMVPAPPVRRRSPRISTRSCARHWPPAAPRSSTPPGAGDRGGVAGPDDHDDGHRERQVALLLGADGRGAARRSACRALYLAPTKALGRIRARRIHELGLRQLRPAIYDGDTRRTSRTRIRREANVILTNPDMLHVGVLPNHAAWNEFLANLAVVVIDEAHVYSGGVFGSHVAKRAPPAAAASARGTARSRGSCWRARRSAIRSSSRVDSRVCRRWR